MLPSAPSANLPSMGSTSSLASSLAKSSLAPLWLRSAVAENISLIEQEMHVSCNVPALAIELRYTPPYTPPHSPPHSLPQGLPQSPPATGERHSTPAAGERHSTAAAAGKAYEEKSEERCEEKSEERPLARLCLAGLEGELSRQPGRLACSVRMRSLRLVDLTDRRGGVDR